MRKFTAGLLLSTTVGLFVVTPSFAASSDDSGIEQIVVTASKTGAQPLQQTPLAITAFSGDQLKDEKISNVKDLVEYTPGLQIAQSTASAEVFIRGIGTTNVFAGSDPDVTVQVDGVYLARPSAQFADLLNVERVEVLRGPQGTLYGRNAAGGTINVISMLPSDSFAANTALTIGNYGLVQTQDYLSGPLADSVQASLAVNYVRHDAYINNIAPGGHDIDDANHGTVSGQIRTEITDQLDATTRADWSTLDEDYESYDHILAPASAGAPLANRTLGDYGRVALNAPQKEESNGGGVSEEVNYHLNDAVSFKSITAYRQNYYRLNGDADATELNAQNIYQREKQHQFSEELTAQINLNNFKGVIGYYYFNEHIASSLSAFVAALPPNMNVSTTQPVVDDEANAFYAQGTYNITDALHVTLGARETLESKDIYPDHFSASTTGVVFPPSVFTTPAHQDYAAFTPKIGLDYQVTDDAMIYASATRGFKSGGFDYAVSSTANQIFMPEHVWSYEVGAKTDWFDKRLQINLTAFLYDYRNLQVQYLLGPGNIFIGNAPKATDKGIESEIIAKPVAGLTLTSNVSLLDATYGNGFIDQGVASSLIPTYINASDPRFHSLGLFHGQQIGTYNASGENLTNAPRFSTLESVQYDYDTGGGLLYGRVEYNYQSREYFDPTNVRILSQGSFGLWNLAIGYQGADSLWKFQALVKNVGDRQYLISAAALSNPPTGHAGDPRTLWFTVARQW